MIRLHATEEEEQKALIEWAHLHELKYPDLKWLFAIPNGGLRHPVIAKKLKAEGVKRGVPDLCLPVPRAPYSGLFLELKASGGRLSPAQILWLTALNLLGYYATVCEGWDAARKVIEQYLTQRLGR